MLAAGFLIAFLLCLGVASAALYVWDAGYEGRVLAGVNVGGVDLSGLDREQASAKLTAAFGEHGAGAATVGNAAGDVAAPFDRRLTGRISRRWSMRRWPPVVPGAPPSEHSVRSGWRCPARRSRPV